MALVAAGCATETGFGPGEFPLTRVNGVAVPYLLLATASCDEFVVSGALTLLADRQFLLTLRTRRDCAATGGGVTVSVVSRAGAWTLTDSLRLTGPLLAQPLAGAVVREDILTFVDSSLLPAGPHAFRFGSGMLPGER